MFKRNFTFSLVLLLNISFSSYSQPFTLKPDIPFHNYNSSNNFNTQYIVSLTTTSKGYVWIGSNGVSRFDGNQFVQFHKYDKPNSGIQHNYTGSIVEDKYHRIWVGSALGLCYYDEHTNHFNTININDKQKLWYAYALAPQNDKLWFLSNYGLCYADINTLKVHTTAINGSLSSLVIYPVNDSTLLVSSYERAYIYHVKENKAEVKKMPSGIYITSVAAINKRIFFGTNAGIWELGSINDVAYQLKGTRKFDINIKCLVSLPALTGDSVLWFGTSTQGLITYSIKQQKVLYQYKHISHNANSIQSNEITGLRADKNNLWIATNTGLTLFNYKELTSNVQMLEGAYVLRVVQDKYNKNISWIATEKEGLIKISSKTGQILHTFHPVAKGKNNKAKVPALLDIVQIDKDRWLLNRRDELMIWNQKGIIEKEIDNKPVLPKNKKWMGIRYIIPAGRDSFYAASLCGLFLCNTKTQKNYPVIRRNDTLLNSPDDMVNGVYDRGTLWIATANGLLRYEISTGKKRRYFIDKNTPYANRNQLSDVAIDQKGNVLTAGIDGIAVLNIKTEKFRFYNDFTTIQNPDCYTLYVRDTIVCINSEAGLILFNLNTGKSFLFVADFTERNSVLPFGTINNFVVSAYRNGYLYFDPAKLFQDTVPSAPVIEKIIVNEKTIYFPSGENQLKFKDGENIISFYFTAFEYTHPRNINFRYKLQGLENNWHFSKIQRIANYIKVPPGNYTFIIQAGNSKNEWNAAVTAFSFKISPPFWATWWFITFSSLVFVGSLAAIAMFSIKKFKLKEKEKTEHHRELVELEMKALRSQMNPHFIFNSLNSIQKFIWENKQEDAAEYLGKFSRLMRMILDNSMQKWITMEDELATLRLYLELEHRRNNNKFDYRISVDEGLDTATILMPPMILQPYVENAIWHGLLPKHNRGDLNIIIKPDVNENIKCIVEDNGVGRWSAGNTNIENERKNISYGMQITSERIKMAETNGRRGNVLIEDLKASDGLTLGTKVIIYIPVNNFVKL